MLLASGCASAPGAPEPTVWKIDPASPEGRQIVAIATEDVISRLGKPASLAVETLNSDGTWTFLLGKFLAPDGTPFDFTGTPFAERAAQGHMSRAYAALFKAVDGPARWARMDSVLGSTGVAWLGWIDQYSVSPELLGLPPDARAQG